MHTCLRFLVSFACAAMLCLTYRDDLPIPAALTLAEVRRVFPTADRLEARAQDVLEVRSASGEFLGWALTTADSTRRGWGGAVPCLIGLAPDQRIQGIVMLPNQETPSFVEYIESSRFFQRWQGQRADSTLRPPDAISGATLTTDAIRAGVTSRLESLTGEIAPPRPARSRFAPILSVAAILIALTVPFLPPKRLWRFWLPMTSSVLLLGFGTGQLLSIATFQSWLKGGWHSGLVWGAPALLAVSITMGFLQGKNWYCALACPFGAAQSLLAAVPFRKYVPGPTARRILEWMAPLLLGSMAGAAFTDFDLSAAEPFAAFGFRAAPAMAIAGLFLGLSLVIPRAWCRFFCPTGWVMRLATQKRTPKEHEDSPWTAN